MNTDASLRPDRSSTPPALHTQDLEIRPSEGLVRVNGRVLMLSVREFELLLALARRAGRIVARADLYAEVWGGTLSARDRSVDVYVSKLRQKLHAVMPDRRVIHTHPGFGYRLQTEPSQDLDNGSVSRQHTATCGVRPTGVAPHDKGEVK